MGIVDFDVVEESNLQRQIIHGTKDLGRRKVESARDRMRDINPHIDIETHETRLTSQNALRLFKNYDIIVDGTDNFPTRYLVNDASLTYMARSFASRDRLVFSGPSAGLVIAAFILNRRQPAWCLHVRKAGCLASYPAL